ncbi:MAG: hypothetical protein V4574_00020 [Pseudomonadota bacterium]
MTGVAKTALADGAAAARALLDRPAVEAVEIAQPPLDELPCRDFVRALLGARGFKLDFNGQAPDAVLAMAASQLFGPGAFAREQALLAEDIATLTEFARRLVDGARPLVAIRTYFAPGDLVWHVDRLNDRTAFRLLWPIGRPSGMRVTPAANIDAPVHRAYMRREHPLLGRMDTHVLRTGAPVERLWAHRPAQIEAMVSGRFPFLRDPALEWEITPGAASIHRVETAAQRGTYHRSSWANRTAPGLQIVITAASDSP